MSAADLARAAAAAIRAYEAAPSDTGRYLAASALDRLAAALPSGRDRLSASSAAGGCRRIGDRRMRPMPTIAMLSGVANKWDAWAQEME